MGLDVHRMNTFRKQSVSRLESILPADMYSWLPSIYPSPRTIDFSLDGICGGYHTMLYGMNLSTVNHVYRHVSGLVFPDALHGLLRLNLLDARCTRMEMNKIRS
jgi:hypothetical protein